MTAFYVPIFEHSRKFLCGWISENALFTNGGAAWQNRKYVTNYMSFLRMGIRVLSRIQGLPDTGTIIYGMRTDIVPRFLRSGMDAVIISVKRQTCAW